VSVNIATDSSGAAIVIEWLFGGLTSEIAVTVISTRTIKTARVR